MARKPWLRVRAVRRRVLRRRRIQTRFAGAWEGLRLQASGAPELRRSAPA